VTSRRDVLISTCAAQLLSPAAQIHVASGRCGLPALMQSHLAPPTSAGMQLHSKETKYRTRCRLQTYMHLYIIGSEWPCSSGALGAS
jgi:hypothetical protein